MARAAGVGVGTLYRHFPTRADLFEAVYRREVDQLADLSVQLSAGPAPTAALRQWLRANVEFVAAKKGMLAALTEAAFGAKELKAYTSVRLTEAVSMLMGKAVAAGEMRADVEPDEVLRMLVALCYSFDRPDWQGSALRLLDVFIDGLERKNGKAHDR